MKWTGHLLSPSMAVSLVALFVALGGAGYAAFSLPSNSVGTKQLQNGAVTGAKLRNGAVTRAKLNLAGATVPNALHAHSADVATTAGGASPTGQAAGDLSGSYPAPTIAPASAPTNIADNPITSTDPCALPSPQTDVFCGTSNGQWQAGLYAGNGVQVWRDRVGEIHIRGEAHWRSTGTLYENADPLFYLPPSERPTQVQSFPVATGRGAGAFLTGSGLLVVYPSGSGPSEGAVALFDPGFSGSDGGTDVFIGEVEFRTDA